MTVQFQEEGHIYTAKNVIYPSVTKIISHSLGECTWGNQELMDLGTSHHKTTVLHDRGLLKKCPDEQRLYLDNWEKFKKMFNPKFLQIDTPMISKKKGFAGTPDRVAEIMGDIVIIDIKRSASNQKRYAYQSMAYKILVEENLKIKIKKRFVVLLQEKWFRLEPHLNDYSDKQTFLTMLKEYKENACNQT